MGTVAHLIRLRNEVLVMRLAGIEQSVLSPSVACLMRSIHEQQLLLTKCDRIGNLITDPVCVSSVTF